MPVTTNDLRSLTASRYPDNTAQEIDAADLRAGMTLIADVIDESVNAMAAAVSFGFPLYASVSLAMASVRPGRGFSIIEDDGLALYQNNSGSAEKLDTLLLTSSITDLYNRLIGVEDQLFEVAPIYNTTAGGIANTSVGTQFKVDSSSPDIAYNVYLHASGGEAVLIASVPAGSALSTKADANAVVNLTGAQTVGGVKTFSSAPVVPDGAFSVAKTSGLQEIADRTEPIVPGLYSDGSLPDGYAWGVLDGDDRMALGIDDAGTTETAALRTANLAIGDDTMSRGEAQGWGQSVTDGSGNVGAAVSQGGRFAAHDPIFKGAGRRALKSGCRFPGDLILFNNTGQSNAHGTTGTGTEGITQTRERGAFGISALYGLMELTNEWFGRRDATNGWNTENPTFGTVGFVLELLEKENGINWQSHDVWLVGSNNGLSGNTLAQLSEGGTSGKYEAAIAQAGAVKNVAENAGLAPSYGMTTWAQGEAEPTSTTYKADLIALAESYRLDAKAATGQTHDPIFVTWQLCQAIAAANFVSRAQLEAANENDLIYCSGPTYHLPRLDGTHFTPVGYKWLGAYFGLVYKRVVIDGQDWSPLQPVHHAVIGNAIDLQFNKRGLVFDTTGDLPMQTNYGFAVTEADGTTAVTISSVAIIGPDRVRITCASAPQPGWRVKYGHSAMSGITAWTYNGPGGNLRDNAGAHLTYDEISKPMHNWCSIFNYEV